MLAGSVLNVRALAAAIAPVLVMAGLVLTTSPADAATVTAKRALAKLKVAPERGAASYDRSKFRHWIDVDGDGCDTREEVLIAESVDEVDRTSDCTILGGIWESWYDIDVWFEPSDVDIDHMVPLKEAWESGSRGWTAQRRTSFANDLGHPWSLEGVTDNVNQSKGERDPAQWLPTYSHCTYAIHWVAVKYRWNLAIDKRERDALASILKGKCGARSLKLPAKGKVLAPTTPPVTPSPTTPPSATDPRFGTCAEARAAGYGPYFQGLDAEYGWYTDADSDGVVCEDGEGATTPPAGGTDPRFSTCGAAISAGYGPYYRGLDPEYDWYRDSDSDGVVCER